MNRGLRGRPTICCGRCGGTGRTELADEYHRTLSLLRLQKDGATAAELAPLAGCQATAMSNRLAQLERHGLAVSRRDGRRRIFTAAEEATP